MIEDNLEETVMKILDRVPEHLEKSDDEEVVQKQEEDMVAGIQNYKTFLMFSATMEPLVEIMARKYLKHPAKI